MITNQRYIAYDSTGVYGPFVSDNTAFDYAENYLTNGHVRPLVTPKPDQHTRPLGQAFRLSA